MITAAPPRARANPVLGSALDLRRSQIRTYERVMREHGDVVRAVVGPPGVRFNLYCVFHPDGVRAVLAGSREGYSKRNQFYAQIAEAFGRGLLTSEGELWQRQRRLVQPLFTRKQIATYSELMVEEAAARRGALGPRHAERRGRRRQRRDGRPGAAGGRAGDLRRGRGQGRQRARLGLPGAQSAHVPARDVAAGPARVLADPGQPQGGARPASALRGDRRADRAPPAGRSRWRGPALAAAARPRSASARGTPYAYFPFGAGPRACIGSYFAMLEAVIASAVLLQRFRIRGDQETVPLDTQGITLRPKGAVPIQLAAR